MTAEEENEPLHEIGVNSPEKNKSVFMEVLNNSKKEKQTFSNNTPTKEEVPFIEVTSLQQDLPQQLKQEEPIVKVAQVYEIAFYENSLERILFTYTTPCFVDNSLKLVNCFTHVPLKENILGLTEIKASCRIELEQTEVYVPITLGCFIKCKSEESWMHLDFETTKKKFDEAVLNAYRKVSPKAQQMPPQQPIVPQNHSNSNEFFQAGNIPVDRGLLLKDI